MKIRLFIQILLLITGGICVLSSALQWSDLEFYIKPLTVPLFFILYWFSVKKVEGLFLIILLLCFLGDIFLLLDLENSFMLILISYASCNLLLFYYLYKNHKPFNFDRTDVVYLVVFVMAWAFIAYEIFDLIQESLGKIKPYGLGYLVLLFFLFNGVVFQYVNTRSTKSLWFLIAILSIVISDTCFTLNKFYTPAIEFKIINACFQLLAVFFLVKFKISNSSPLKIKNT